MKALQDGRIILAGGTGLVGTHLARALASRGVEVLILSRKPRPTDLSGGIRIGPWEDLPRMLNGCHAVVNLAGEGIADRRWSPERKRLLLESRIGPTRTIAQAIAESGHHPTTVVNASAIGIYGDRGDERLDEGSSPGTGFLPEVCQAWEDAAEAIQGLGVRVIKLRIGAVLAREGGALPRMALPIRLGAGTILGSGRQGFSWIHREDLVRLILESLQNPSYAGVVNATAPEPCSHEAFTRLMARHLHRPLWPLPAFFTRSALRFLVGEMAGPMLLGGAYVVPRKALDLGFTFRYPEASLALKDLL
jgi:hypothetical protein